MEEIKKIISVEVNGEKTVKDLKDEIKSLRDALLNTEKGTDDYRKIVDKLVEDQKELTNVMSVGKNEVKAAAGSYNALVQEMSALKKVWREVSDEGERNKIGEQIKEINDKLKGMDASIGNYQRNVGNYSSALDNLGGVIGKLNPKLGNTISQASKLGGEMKNMNKLVGDGTKALGNLGKGAGVAAAAIAAVVIIVKSLGDALNDAATRNEELQLALNNAKTATDAANVAWTNLKDNIANYVAPTLLYLQNLWNDLKLSILSILPGFKDIKKVDAELKTINTDLLRLEQAKRDFIKEEADAKKTIAEYDKIIEDTTQSQEKRLDAINKKEKLQTELQEKRVKLATDHYNIIERQNKLTNSGTEDLNKQAQAYAAMVEAQAGLTNLQTENMKRANRISGSGSSSGGTGGGTKVNDAEIQKKLNEVLDLKLSEAVYNEKKATFERELKLMQTRLTRIAKGTEEELKLNAEKLDKQKQLDELEVQYAAQQAVIAEKAANEEAEKEAKSIKNKEKRLEALENVQKAHNKVMEGIELDLTANLESIDTEYMNNVGILYNDFYLEQDRLAIQAKANMVEKLRQGIKIEPDDMIKYLEEYLNLQKLALDKVYKQEDEAFEDWEARYLEALTNVKQAQDLLNNYIAGRYKDTSDKLSLEADRRFDIIVDKQEIEGRLEVLESLKELDIRYAKDTIENAEQLQIRLEAIEKEYGEERERYSRMMNDFNYYAEIEYLQKRMEAKLKASDEEKQLRLKEAEETIKNEADLQQTRNEIIDFYAKQRLEIETQAQEDIAQLPYKIVNAYWLTGQDIFDAEKSSIAEFENYIRNIQQETEESDEAFYYRRLALQKEYNDRKKALFQQEVSYYQNYATATSSILSTVAGSLQDKIKREKEAGKISGEEAERQFKSVKALQYSTTWINTLAAMSQIMADPSIPTYWVKAALAAAQLASGIATTIQIKNTSLGSANVSSSAGQTSSAAVTPIMTDFAPEYMTNVTSQTETDYLANALGEKPIKAYVVESEVSAAQTLANNRQSETTF